MDYSSIVQHVSLCTFVKKKKKKFKPNLREKKENKKQLTTVP